MVEVVFDYQQNKTMIQGNLNNLFEEIIEKYTFKTKLDKNDIYFISNGNIINKNDKLENIMSDSDKRNKKIIILVYSINNNINIENTNIKKSKDIICPECKEMCKYEIKDFKIKLYGCKKGHIKENIKLNEFENNQVIDISQIKCDVCKKENKANTFNNEFYICCECKINLCPLCKSIHNKKHSIINYDNKNYICNKHNEPLFEYCEDCNIDMCISCSSEHKNHKIILYQEKLIDIKNLRDKMNEFKNEINKLKENLEEIINKFKKLIGNMDIIYNINNNILNNYETKKTRNYSLLSNINYVNDYIGYEIIKIKNEYDYGNNINKLLDIIDEKEDEKEIIYKPNKDGNVRIFGYDFVLNNKQKCKIIYNNKEYELKEYINDIDKNYNNKDDIKIKIKGIENVTNMKGMFSGCNTLSSLPDLSELNTSKVKNMSEMFSGCKTLSSLPDISKWDTSNVKNMSKMFSCCKILSSLPNISKWNTSNVKNMSDLFSGCNELTSLPDISNWKTSNVEYMNNMLESCHKISSLPDISKWDTSNVKSMRNMFYYCNALSSLPDISKWNTSNVKDMYGMFISCNALSSLPDISKWNTSYATKMDDMFKNCKKTLNIPSKFKNN